ncbi:unnamed protein product [Sphagnum troendelagicum]|uniref:F-box domain-containing protein n=1 Tax=Sphagnum troendelagicum TaxID=128251 RepID=A0ABP0UGG0_9BRYO
MEQMEKKNEPLQSPQLIPGLPEEIALECLLKVSYKCHPCLQKVCRRWEKEVTDPLFYRERKKAGTTRHCVCMVQALVPEAVAAAGVAGGEGIELKLGKQDAATVLYGISVYDLQQRTWERLPMIPEFPQGLPLFCRLVSLDGKLIVVGGWHPWTWEALRCTYVFSFSTQNWSRGADMPRVRSFFACAVMGGSVFVAGGHDENKTALSTADVYNVDADRWESLPDMSEERDECAGVVFHGKLFVVSGYGTHTQGQFGSSADVLDPYTGSWSRRDEMWGPMTGSNSSSCPSGGFAVARIELYAFHRQSLLRYCPLRNVWSTLFVMGSAKSQCRGMIYTPQEEQQQGRRGTWQTIEFSEEFSGLSHTTCIVEI